MTAQSNLAHKLISDVWQRPQPRRWLLLLVAVGALLVMAFYTVTDASRLAGSPVLAGADWAGYAVCHRITSHSFLINGVDVGRQFPLCARCTGMYLGAALAFVIFSLAGRLGWSELPPRRVLLVLLGFIGLMGIDGVNSYSYFFPDAPHLYAPRNWLRLLTGMGTGLAMGIFILPALAQTLWRRPNWRAPVGSLRELAGMALVALTAVLLLLTNNPTVLYVLALVSVAGLLLVLSGINAVFLLILLRRDGRAENWRQTAVPLLISLTLALVELSAVSIVRFNLTGTMTGFPGL